MSPPGNLLLPQQQTIEQQAHRGLVEQEVEGFHGWESTKISPERDEEGLEKDKRLLQEQN